MKWQIETYLAGGLLVLALFGVAMAGPLEDAKAAFRKGVELHYHRPVAKKRFDPNSFDAKPATVQQPQPEFDPAEQEYYATALQIVRPLADQGNAEAQAFLGWLYECGSGVPPDYAQAAAWYRKAADQGNAEGQFHLGELYAPGKGVPQDDAQATAWYRKAADQGYAPAQLNMGGMYEQGLGVPQDYAQAIVWYRKAADQGYAFAQAQLGDMYRDGLGVPQDYVRAHMWYNLAASHGSSAKDRDDIAAKMTPAQIAEAQRMASEWVPKK